MHKLAFVLALLLGANLSFGSTIAIIDSGTDMLHKDIAPKAWINQDEIPANDRDEDGNGYQDDVHGWNFAEGNNKVIDYSYLGTLTFDIRKFFEIQGKAIMGTATDAEIAWMKAKVQDQEFLKQLQVYGNFMHGTHVAGIAAQEADDVKILAVKLIPTEVKLPFSVNKEDNGLGMMLLKAGLGALAKQQMTLLEEIAEYVNGHKADVANGSFGTGYKQARMIVDALAKTVLRRDPTEDEAHMLAKHFINTMLREGQHMVAAAPNTLFVFAAGNDGLDNDEFPTSPTNIEASNVLSVAATMGTTAIASFSNFGKKMVDVAAPGVVINSAVPGNQYLQVSGTSQAAPYVANIAGMIKDINRELGPSEIKKIIMKTVDLRDYLADKVRTGGLVNTKRAVRAATLSLSMPLSRAVAQARIDIQDQEIEKALPGANQYAEFVLPLPTGFKF